MRHTTIDCELNRHRSAKLAAPSRELVKTGWTGRVNGTVGRVDADASVVPLSVPHHQPAPPISAPMMYLSLSNYSEPIPVLSERERLTELLRDLALERRDLVRALTCVIADQQCAREELAALSSSHSAHGS